LSSGVHFSGIIYRALNPVWAAQPLSGEGAALYGGRFNRRGQSALYCSLSPVTAMREANQVGALQPTTLVAIDADLFPLFDARDAAALTAVGYDAAMIGDPSWREASRAGEKPPGQRLAIKLIEQGYCGLIVPSFARGAAADAANIVLWRWGARLPHRLSVIDDEDRLGRA
jgi:RES domain-containing protein